jgi:hypothetical protein
MLRMKLLEIKEVIEGEKVDRGVFSGQLWVESDIRLRHKLDINNPFDP